MNEKIIELTKDYLIPMEHRPTHISHSGKTVYNFYGAHTCDVLLAIQKHLLNQGYDCKVIEYSYLRGCIMSRNLGMSLSYCEGDFAITEITDYDKEVREYEEFMKEN